MFEDFNSSELSGEALFAQFHAARETPTASSDGTRRLVVIGKHRYYNLFSAQLADCGVGSTGELKNPLTILNPIDLIWKTQQPEELKFYASLVKFQTFYEKAFTDTAALKALVQNPLGHEFYLHDETVSEKITLRSISPVRLSLGKIDLKVSISFQDGLYTVGSDLFINKAFLPLARVNMLFGHFLVLGTDWYLCEDTNLLHAVSYFKKQEQELVLPHDLFLKFRVEVLSAVESYIDVEHAYLHAATPAQLADGGFYGAPEMLVYLSDLEHYVMLNPVMKYGEAEIPVLSKRQIYAQDRKGNIFGVERDAEAEDAFTALLIKQHPDFWEQMENPLPYFYLHKTRFLDEEWFLDAFEEWASRGIQVLGFNGLKGNNLNGSKASVSIQILSGYNWFNAKIGVRFGHKKASLKQVQQAVKNKSKYVKLDDGTLGILPEEWLSKLKSYLEAGEVADDETLQIPKTSFAILSELYEAHMLDEEVKEEINRYETQLTCVEKITPVPVPAGLHAVLRPYQLQGLSWLNYLDDLNFGGCLADDMGLGKTVQLIAFLLLLRAKAGEKTHLLVVPTSLLHNWTNELQKFAPSLRVHTHHGVGREKSTAAFGAQELIMTSYGTLVSDISFLRQYVFDYIILDESQNIKNPSSQRYKAARLLRSRNKILLSGTPLENSTFDVYAQLSFACPGLLGTRQYFKNTYAIPIDRFKNKRSAAALQRRISPFILRRTKTEVAKELPEKTEVTLYCEMGLEQRRVYDAYEREFREYVSASGEDEIIKNAMHVLKGITKLRQICNSPLLVGEQLPAAGSSSKIEVLLEQVRDISRRHKILVFSQFVSMLELVGKELAREKIKYVSLTGSTRNREEVVNQFQEDAETRVFLISLKAGGTGLNLTAADYVFLVDPWWNPAVENQAIDRSYRIGQQKNVIAVRLICPDTVEEKMLLLQQHKAKLASDLISTDEGTSRLLTKGMLLGLTSS